MLRWSVMKIIVQGELIIQTGKWKIVYHCFHCKLYFFILLVQFSGVFPFYFIHFWFFYKVAKKHFTYNFCTIKSTIRSNIYVFNHFQQKFQSQILLSNFSDSHPLRFSKKFRLGIPFSCIISRISHGQCQE